MTRADGSTGIGTAQVGEAEAAARIYDRIAWISYAAIFLAIPFVVLIFRLHMQTWHYYLAGGLFLAGAAVICVIVVRD